MISISINGTAINQFNIEIPITETLDSELDTFSFIIKSHNKQIFNKYSKVQLTFSDISYSRIYALQDYTEKLQGETWVYNIDCISPTKILENIIINGMAMTDKSLRYGQEINRVIKKIITQVRLQGSSNFTLTPVGNLSSLISETYSNMFFKWDGQHTAREILDDMLGRLNYYVNVTDYEISGNEIVKLYLDCQCYNGAENLRTQNSHMIASGSSIENVLSDINNNQRADYKIANVESYNNSEYEVPNIDGILQNGIDKNSIIYCGCTKLRSDALGIYSSDQLSYVTTEPIYDIKYFNIFIPILVTCKYYHGRNGYNSRVEYEQNVIMYFPVTIASGEDEDYSGIFGKYLFEKTEFDTLTTERQKYALWFERGKNNIYGFTDTYKDGFAGRFNDIAIEKITTTIRNDFPVNLITDGRMTYSWDEYISEPFEYCYGFPITNNDTESTCYFMDANMQLTDNIIVPRGSGPWAVDTAIRVWDWQPGQTVDSIPDDTIISMTKVQNQSTVTYNYKNFSYDLAYYPYISSLIRLKKRDNERDEVIPGYTKNLSIMSNQTENSIDIMNYLKAQQSTVDSMGERVLIIDTKIKTQTPWNLGDYIMIHSGDDYNFWKLIKRDITVYNERTIKVRYYFSYNYNHAISAAIDREKMTSDLPLDGYVNRYIFINGDFFDVDIADGADTIVVDAIDVNEDDVFAVMPLVKFGSNDVGNGFTKFYKTSFYDNYSASVYQDTVSGSKIYAPLRYTNSDGSLNELRLFFVKYSDIWKKYDMSKFPKIDNFDIQLYDSLEINNIYKDPFEKLVIVIEL